MSLKVIAEAYEKSQVAEPDDGSSCGQKDICGRETATAKSLQSCPTLCDPIDGSHQALLSLGFSRQEHWSGLPFPSPMHASEK